MGREKLTVIPQHSRVPRALTQQEQHVAGEGSVEPERAQQQRQRPNPHGTDTGPGPGTDTDTGRARGPQLLLLLQSHEPSGTDHIRPRRSRPPDAALRVSVCPKLSGAAGGAGRPAGGAALEDAVSPN